MKVTLSESKLMWEDNRFPVGIVLLANEDFWKDCVRGDKG